MRRSENAIEDMAEFEFLTRRAKVGYLGILTPDNYPRVVPVNFAARDKIIYLHGAMVGEKYDSMLANPRVTFSIDIPYSVIPSYWISPKSARGATMYYRSALVRGRAVLVENGEEKCLALTMLMNKFQPEGNFAPILPESPAYKKILTGTAVFRIDPEHIDMKSNLPRSKPRHFKEKIIKNLRERGTDVDLKTADEIEKFL